MRPIVIAVVHVIPCKYFIGPRTFILITFLKDNLNMQVVCLVLFVNMSLRKIAFSNLSILMQTEEVG